MALRFQDGFDHYNSLALMQQKWTTLTFGSFQTGRFSGLGYAGNQGTPARIGIDAQGTWTVQFALYYTNVGANMVYKCEDSTSTQVDLRVDATHHLYVTRNGTTLGTSASALALNAWHYVKFQFTIASGVGGSFNLNVDNATVLNVSGVNTQATANATGDTHGFYGYNDNTWITDDLVIMDGVNDGTIFNTFIPEARIFTSYPTGAGASTNFTPSAGANWQNVKETSPDGDTTYNESTTVGNIDLFPATALPAGTTAVYSAQVCVSMRKTDAAVQSIQAAIRGGGTTNAFGASTAALSTYLMARSIFLTDPSTGVAFTLAGANAAQIGYKKDT